MLDKSKGGWNKMNAGAKYTSHNINHVLYTHHMQYCGNVRKQNVTVYITKLRKFFFYCHHSLIPDGFHLRGFADIFSLTLCSDLPCFLPAEDEAVAC